MLYLFSFYIQNRHTTGTQLSFSNLIIFFFSHHKLKKGVLCLKQIIIASYSFIAAVIGAGFASGQEIMCYFVRFGKLGFPGIVIFAAVFAVFSFSVMCACKKLGILTFDGFLDIFPHSALRNTIKYSIGIFAFAVYAVMISAAGGIGAMITPLSQPLCALICAIFCALLLCRGADGVFNINGILGVILTVGIIACCMYILRYREHHAFSQAVSALSDSYIYSGYNLISLTPVMAVLGSRLGSGRAAAAVSGSSAAALFVMTALMYGILSIYAHKVDLGEFPMLTLAYRQNSALGAFYYVMLAGAILTTLLSSGGSIAESFGFDKKPLPVFAVTSIAYLLSGAGFGRLVNTAYRFCGIAGGFLLTIITIFCIRAIFKAEKEK